MLRVVFMGSPDFAVPTLNEILAAGHDIAAVYCQPPRPAGRRGLETTPTPVQAFAEAAGLPVLTPRSLRDAETQAAFTAHGADVAVVVAYGLILPQAILEATPHGCLNLHPSRLPRWRGAAPIQRTLMAGDRETAVMVMRMDAGLDTGPVCLAEHLDVPNEATAGDLHDDLAKCGADLMVRALAALERDSLDCQPQPADGATYAAKIDKAEAEMNWARPTAELHNHIRGLSPFPGAWTPLSTAGKSERLKVLRARPLADLPADGPPGTLAGGENDAFRVNTADGQIELVLVQRAGRQAMAGPDVRRGLGLPAGAALSST